MIGEYFSSTYSGIWETSLPVMHALVWMGAH